MSITPATHSSSPIPPIDRADDTRARLDLINTRIASACQRAGRASSEVTLVAVSKTVSAARIRSAIDCGVRILGENRVQEASPKMAELSDLPSELGVRWHFIGHLQSNKARRAVELFETIHSVDTISLAERLDRAAAELGRRLRILLEVNLGGESSKSGMAGDDVATAAEKIARCNDIDLVGLMTVPPYHEQAEKVRPYFRKLRELRDELRAIVGDSCSELSMGMSHDFEIAIEEGATVVRVGTALFGSRQ
ncbi:MAG: YggS family pyridoxal phosphate-dependent enzyme [Acidobacteriota bacterium]